MAFASAQDFAEALDEVTSLVDISELPTISNSARAALLKSAILLLATKIETFMEQAAEEARYNIEVSQLEARKLPRDLLVAVLQATLDDAFISKLRSGNPRVLDDLGHLKSFLDGGQVSKIPVEIKFSYGKHGENEVRKLFKKLGIADIFAARPLEGGLDENELRNMRAHLNSLTALRNNIIHTDASPGLTSHQLREYIGSFSSFVIFVVSALESHCGVMLLE